MRVFWVLALGILIPLPALADGTIGLRITDEGLDWIADEALAQVPQHVDLDDIEIPLMDCWPRDSALELWQGQVDIEHLDLSFPFDDDQVGIVFDAGAHITGTALLDAIACLPLSISCDLDVTVNRAIANAAIALGTGEDGKLIAQLGAVDIAIDPNDLDIEFSNCTDDIDDRLDQLYDQAEEALLRIAHDQIQRMIDDNVRPKVDALLGTTLAFPVESAGVEATIGPSGILRGNRALLLTASVGIEPTTISDCITPDGEVVLPPDSELAFTEWDPSPFALGLTDRVLNEAVAAAWQAGQLCFEPKDLSAFDGLFDGLPAGVDMQLQFGLGAPPLVDIEPDGVHMTLAGVSAILEMQTPDGPASAVFRGGATARAILELDPATNGLHLRTTDLAIADMQLTDGALPDGVDLQAVIENLVFPMIQDFVGNVRIADSVVPVSDYWVIVDAIDYYDGSAAMAFELFKNPDNDTGRPDTIIEEGPAEPVLPGAPASIRVSGVDDLVPARLLRYQILLAGEDEWTDATFSGSYQVRQYAEGEWVYRVRAVDLAGNVDEDPAKITLVVEAEPDLDHPDALPPPPDDDGGDPDATATETDGDGGCSCRQAPGIPASPWPGVAIALVLAAAILSRRLS